MPPVAAAASVIVTGLGAVVSGIAGVAGAAASGISGAIGTIGTGIAGAGKAAVGIAGAATSGTAGAAGQVISAAQGISGLLAQQRTAKAQEKAQKAATALQTEQAGEYLNITKKEMELQTGQSMINTLASLMVQRTGTAAQPQIVTLPAAKTYSWFDNLNRQIDQLIRG